MLSGSAHTRKVPAATSGHAASAAMLRKRKHIKHASRGGVLAEVRHRVGEAERRRAIHGIDAAGHYGAGPAAYASQHGHVLLAIRPFISDGLSDDSRTRLKLPEQSS